MPSSCCSVPCSASCCSVEGVEDCSKDVDSGEGEGCGNGCGEGNAAGKGKWSGDIGGEPKGGSGEEGNTGTKAGVVAAAVEEEEEKVEEEEEGGTARVVESEVAWSPFEAGKSCKAFASSSSMAGADCG